MNKYKIVKFELIKNLFLKNSIEIETTLNNDVHFNTISSLDKSTSNDLTFFHNNKYFDLLKTTNAKACLIQEKYISNLNNKCIPIVVADPYLAYALISNLFSLDHNISNGQLHSSSIIYDDSIVSENVQLNANVIIKEQCIINNNVIIFENSIVGPNVIIGKGTKIMNNCIISNTILGKDCLIQSGAAIGEKGFGFTPEQKIDIKHIGNVIIGDNVDIGSNTTIDRATINSTKIGNNCRIDNLVQIAHNVQIGNNTIIAAQSGIAGSTIIGNNCTLGGQVGVAGHLKIGNNVIIAGKSGVTKNIDDNSTIGGFPAVNINKWRKSIVRQYKGIK